MDFLGDPGSIDRMAGELTAAQGALSRTSGEVTSAVSALVPGSWHGSAAGAFQGHMATETWSIDAVSGVAGQMASVLTHLAAELRHAQDIARQAESIAHAHGLAVGPGGQISSPVGRAGLPPNPAQVQAHAQAQALMDSAISMANGARSRAAGALSGLTVPQVRPGVSPQAAEAWAQQAAPGRPGSPPTLGDDLWQALRGNALPSSAMGALGIGLWGLGRGLTVFGKTASWMTMVELGRFAPRNALGQFTSLDMPWWQRAMSSTDGKNWVANPYMADSRGVWSTAGKWGGRAGGVLAIGTAGLSQWMQDSNRADLTTSERVGRTTYRGLVAGGAAWAGAVAGGEIGGAIGTAICPGVGTVIGGAIGGIAGGVIGSGAGNWVVDHTVDAVGHGTEAVVNAVGDAGSTAIHAGGTALHAVEGFGGSAVHTVSHVLDDINPF